MFVNVPNLSRDWKVNKFAAIDKGSDFLNTPISLSWRILVLKSFVSIVHLQQCGRTMRTEELSNKEAI